MAVTAAKENIELNKVEAIVEVTHGNLLESIDIKPNIIVANILAEVIMTFSADATSLLPEDGLFIVSGIIGQKRDLVKNDLVDKGFEIIESVLNGRLGCNRRQEKGCVTNLQRYFLENHLMKMGML